MKKLVIFSVLILSAALLAGCAKKVSQTSSTSKESSPVTEALRGKDEIFKAALNLYAAKKQEGTDMTTGPCLGKIADDWVLDIAHNPRQSVDDKAENQCADFRNKSAHHFIELDPEGNLITAN